MKIILLTLVSILVASCMPESNGKKKKQNDLQSNEIHTTTIIGGQDSNISQRPYQVSLQKKYIINSYHFCGGSIIDKRIVVTAAHCVQEYIEDNKTQNPGNLNILAGTEFHKSTNEGQRINVSKIVVHPHWNIKNLDRGNDIALLVLEEDITHPKAKKIKLPGRNYSESFNGGETLTLSGWGKWSNNSRVALPSQLQVVDLSYVTDLSCEQKWTSSTILTQMSMDNLICVKYSNHITQSACHGDSGGPLTYLDPTNGETLLGITSFGIAGDCSTANHPNVFTQVSTYTSWIDQELASLGIERDAQLAVVDEPIDDQLVELDKEEDERSQEVRATYAEHTCKLALRERRLENGVSVGNPNYDHCESVLNQMAYTCTVIGVKNSLVECQTYLREVLHGFEKCEIDNANECIEYTSVKAFNFRIYFWNVYYKQIIEHLSDQEYVVMIGGDLLRRNLTLSEMAHWKERLNTRTRYNVFREMIGLFNSFDPRRSSEFYSQFFSDSYLDSIGK